MYTKPAANMLPAGPGARPAPQHPATADPPALCPAYRQIIPGDRTHCQQNALRQPPLIQGPPSDKGSLAPQQAAQLAERDATVRQLSMTPACLLYIFLGCLGLHRFYLRRKGSGLAMLLISVLSAEILGLLICLPWAIVDLFLIPGITRQENTKARDDSYRRYGLALTPGGQQW